MGKKFQIKNLDNGEILCPKCENMCVHIKKTTINPNDVDTLKICLKRATHTHNLKGKIELIHEDGGPVEDYSINLHYMCENGHLGIISFWFHEGSTYLEHEDTSIQHF